MIKKGYPKLRKNQGRIKKGYPGQGQKDKKRIKKPLFLIPCCGSKILIRLIGQIDWLNQGGIPPWLYLNIGRMQRGRLQSAGEPLVDADMCKPSVPGQGMWSRITNAYANLVQIDTLTLIRRSMIAVLEIAGPLAHPSSSLFWVALGVRVHLKIRQPEGIGYNVSAW